MKFLAITRTKDTYYMLPLETRMDVMKGALAYVEKCRKAGKCKEFYFTADLKGGTSIWEVESSEEAARLMLKNPDHAFMDIDIQPVVEWDAGVKALTEYRKRFVKR